MHLNEIWVKIDIRKNLLYGMLWHKSLMSQARSKCYVLKTIDVEELCDLLPKNLHYPKNRRS